MSGFELIEAIRQLDNRAKVIVLSSYDGDADIQRALDAGAQGYVAKGLVREELLNAIRTVYRAASTFRPSSPSDWWSTYRTTRSAGAKCRYCCS
jgi:DNA-binding NarL/FixJ family response regulator